MSSATSTTVTVDFDPTAVNKQSDIISAATRTKAGVMTAAQVQQLGLGIALDDVALYVDGTNGSNANAGTAAAPFATVKKALSMVPSTWKKSCRIYVAPGTYVGDLVLPTGEGVGPEATPLVIVGAYTDELGTLTATGASADGTLWTVGSLSLTPDAYRGALLRCVSGANAGLQTQIVSNDGTTFEILVEASYAGSMQPVSPGDTFVIERPDVIISQSTVLWRSGGDLIGLIGIAFDNTTVAVDGRSVYLQGCSFTNGTWSNTNGASIHYGGEGTNTPWVQDPDSLFSAQATGAGCYMANMFGSFFGCNITAAQVIDSSFFFSGIGVTALYLAINSRGTTWLNAGGATFNIGNGTFFGGPLTKNVIASGGFPGAGSLIFDSLAQMSFCLGVDISDGGGSGIVAKGGSRVYIGGPVTSSTPNAEYGLAAIESSVILYDEPSVDVSGTLGDTIIGATPKTYGVLAGTGFTESNAGGSTLSRISPLGV